jgi:hypothetical protein
MPHSRYTLPLHAQRVRIGGPVREYGNHVSELPVGRTFTILIAEDGSRRTRITGAAAWMQG